MKMSSQHEKALSQLFSFNYDFVFVISFLFCYSSMQKDLLPFTAAPTFSQCSQEMNEATAIITGEFWVRA